MGCVRSYVGGQHFTHSQLEGLWIQAGGPRDKADVAAAIAQAESSGYADAYCVDSNGSIDRGLWQINSVHGALSTFDVVGNARAAVSVSSGGSDFNPWTTYVSGAYRGYLTGTVAPTSSTVHSLPFKPPAPGFTLGQTTVPDVQNVNPGPIIRDAFNKLGEHGRRATHNSQWLDDLLERTDYVTEEGPHDDHGVFIRPTVV